MERSETAKTELAFTGSCNARNRELADDLLRQVEGWKEALPLFAGIVNVSAYNPDERKRDVRFSRYFKGDITPIIVELPSDKRHHELILAAEGKFIICSFDDNQIYFQEISKADLASHMSEDVYAAVIETFRAEHERTLEELERQVAKVGSLKSWRLFPAQEPVIR